MTFGMDNVHNMAAALGVLPFQTMSCTAHSFQLQRMELKASLLNVAKLWDTKQNPVNSTELKSHLLQLYQEHEM